MIFNAFKKTFSSIGYVFIAFAVALAVFALSVLLPNKELVFQLVFSTGNNIYDVVGVLIGLLGSIKTNFTLFSAANIIAISVLFGINTAMLIYLVKIQKQQRPFEITTSFSGLMGGIFGTGCAACGTLVLAPFLTFIGAGGLISLLPFGGQEFGVFGAGILAFSIFLTAKSINKNSCRA